VRVVADSHAIVWYVQGSKRLSERAGEVLAEAEAERSLVVSVATLIDLWYVSQTTQSVTAEQLAGTPRFVRGGCPGAGDGRHRGRHDQYPESQRPRPLGPADHGDRDCPSGPFGNQGLRYPSFGVGADHLVNSATWPPRR
jgi:hypothetical protein